MLQVYYVYFCLFRKPELLYFCTKETGSAKQNLRDLFPYNLIVKAAFGSSSMKKLKAALAEADLVVEN